MAFVERLGVLQKDTMEGPLWRETLGRRSGSHDVAELVGGMCHGNGCRQETTRLYVISCKKRRDGDLSLTIGCSARHWLDPFARVKSSLLFKIHGPSERELVDKTADSTRYIWTSQRRRGGTLRQLPSTQE